VELWELWRLLLPLVISIGIWVLFRFAKRIHLKGLRIPARIVTFMAGVLASLVALFLILGTWAAPLGSQAFRRQMGGIQQSSSMACKELSDLMWRRLPSGSGNIRLRNSRTSGPDGLIQIALSTIRRCSGPIIIVFSFDITNMIQSTNRRARTMWPISQLPVRA
jgi:hypothetical protein